VKLPPSSALIAIILIHAQAAIAVVALPHQPKMHIALLDRIAAGDATLVALRCGREDA
jgi:hypothetical protein